MIHGKLDTVIFTDFLPPGCLEWVFKGEIIISNVNNYQSEYVTGSFTYAFLQLFLIKVLHSVAVKCRE